MLQERVPQSYEPITLGTATRRRRVWAALLPQRGRGVMRVMLSVAAAMADLAAIAGVTLASELSYRIAFSNDDAWPTETRGLQLTALLSLVIVTTNALRGEYALDRLVEGRAGLRRVVSLWFVAWAVVLVIGFLTKTTTDYSRLVSIVVFFVGLPTLFASRLAMSHLIGRSLNPASPTVSRVHLVGYEEDIHAFYASNHTDGPGLRVVGTSYLRRTDPQADTATRYEQLQIGRAHV